MAGPSVGKAEKPGVGDTYWEQSLHEMEAKAAASGGIVAVHAAVVSGAKQIMEAVGVTLPEFSDTVRHAPIEGFVGRLGARYRARETVYSHPINLEEVDDAEHEPGMLPFAKIKRTRTGHLTTGSLITGKFKLDDETKIVREMIAMRYYLGSDERHFIDMPSPLFEGDLSTSFDPYNDLATIKRFRKAIPLLAAAAGCELELPSFRAMQIAVPRSYINDV